MSQKIYDWDRWFRSRRFALLRGQDYDCSQPSMAQQIRNAACARGISVSIVEVAEGFEIEVEHKERASHATS